MTEYDREQYGSVLQTEDGAHHVVPEHQQYYQHPVDDVQQQHDAELQQQQVAMSMMDPYAMGIMGHQGYGAVDARTGMPLLPHHYLNMVPQSLQTSAGIGVAYPRMPLPNEMMGEEQPTYVNALQFRRIVKRRQARAKLEASKKISSIRKEFLHESRHNHAMRRQRGPGGRFLTKEELEEMEAKGEFPRRACDGMIPRMLPNMQQMRELEGVGGEAAQYQQQQHDQGIAAGLVEIAQQMIHPPNMHGGHADYSGVEAGAAPAPVSLADHPGGMGESTEAV